MMKLGTETGSLMNHIYSRSAQPEPKVGDGATEMCWTDRHAGTIVDVVRAKNGNIKYIVFQQDTATRIDKNGMSDAQQYSYQPNPDAPRIDYRLTKKGWTSRMGQPIVIGWRMEYHDYTF